MPFGLVSAAVVGAGIVGAGVVGAVVSADSTRHAVNTQKDIADKAQATQDSLLQKQVAQADELMAFNKQVYAEGKARQTDVDVVNKKVVEQNLSQATKNEQRSDETYDFYKSTGRPLVEKSLKEASEYDSQGNIDAARGRATADVAQAFDNSQQQTTTALSRMGVNASSGRFMAIQQRLQADKAAMLAGAATGAEDKRREGGVALRQQGSNLAQGFPAQSLGQSGQAAGNGQAAAGTAGAGGAQNAALGNTAMNGMVAGAGIYGSASRGYGDIYNGRMQQANNIAQLGQQEQAGWGKLIGFGMGGMADGGKVEGPGTGTSDEVPSVNTDTGQRIQLSNGEYVISADTVRAMGTKFFDRLQEKHHTPVNVGRSK